VRVHVQNENGARRANGRGERRTTGFPTVLLIVNGLEYHKRRRYQPESGNGNGKGYYVQPRSGGGILVSDQWIHKKRRKKNQALGEGW